MTHLVKTLTLLTAAFATTGATAQLTTSSLVPDPNALSFDHVPNRIFIRFADPENAVVKTQILDEVGGTIKSESKLVPGLVTVDTAVDVERALKLLSTKRNTIKYVEPVYIVEALDTIPNDPSYGNLYGMDQVRAPQAWDEHVGDQEFVIAIIDTGIDYNHPDLQANIWTNPGEIPGNGQDDDGNGYVDDVHGYDFYDYNGDPMDSNGHGTHCGGTVGGVGNNSIGVAGVNWQCRLVGAQFLGPSGSGSLDGAVDAVEYCAVNGFKVSNNSWGGGGFSQAMFDVVQAAGDDFGHVFVAAAGNGGYYGASYPGAMTCTNLICVAATDINENMASFSQYHDVEVDLGAPGVDVLSTTPGNNYSYYSGTSMATPHVAGGVGLIYSVLGEASAVEVKDIILSTVRPISSMQGNTVTGGVLNVADALDATFLGPKITMNTTVPGGMDPNTPLAVSVNVDPRQDTISGGVKLHYRNGSSSNWSVIDMALTGLQQWGGEVPGMDCNDEPEFYVSVEGSISGLVEHPSGGAANAYNWMIGDLVLAYEDNGNSNGDWTVVNSLVDGGWDRGIPVNCNRGDPSSDYDGSGQCWMTDNSTNGGDCNSDVDEGSTTLTSGVIDLSGVDNPTISYARWFHNSFGAAPNTDTFLVEWSSDYGLNWYELETVGPAGPEVNGGWVQVAFAVNDFAGDVDSIQLRFTASDIGADTQSVVEAGVDAISVTSVDCDDSSACPADATGDGFVDVSDLLAAIADWGSADSDADTDGDGTVGVGDILMMIDAWGACE